MNKLNQTTLDSIVQRAVKHKNIHGAVFHVASADNTINLISAGGNLGPIDRYYIASINKLMLSALTLRLCQEQQLNLSDKITSYLPETFTKGLLVYKGIDYSGALTIQHLISHTSGLPCYLIDKQADGSRNMTKIHHGMDQAWPLEKVVDTVRKMKPVFAPGTRGKAHYGETNFRLLGRILEQVTAKPLQQLLQELFSELRMTETVVLPPHEAVNVAPVYARQKQISIEQYWASTHHDVASTAQDTMKFLQAFFSGRFYSDLDSLKQWNNIFFPFKYGIGIQQFYIPRFLSPFKRVPQMIGHSGSVGSVAFYLPEKEVFITGTINQAAQPSLAFQTMMRIVNKI